MGGSGTGWPGPNAAPCVATQCPSETYDPLLQSTKDFPDEVISFMRSHQLMWEPVYPQGRQPVLVRVNVPYRLRQLLVHRLETESRHYDVLFLGTGGNSPQLWGCCHCRAACMAHRSCRLGWLRALTAPSPAVFTDEGKILKVGLAGGVSHGTEVISLEEISVTKVREARAGPRWLDHAASPRPVASSLQAPAASHWPLLGRSLASLLVAPTCPDRQVMLLAWRGVRGTGAKSSPHPVPGRTGARPTMGGLSPGLKAWLPGRAALGCPH